MRYSKTIRSRGDVLDLWEYLKHGDLDHQLWLLEALEAYFEDGARPPERKKG